MVATPGVGAFLVFEQDGTGALQLVDTPSSLNPTAVTVADLVPGGRLEIAGADGSLNQIRVFAFDSGLGAYGFPTTIDVGSSPADVIAVNLNGDGLLDLAPDAVHHDEAAAVFPHQLLVVGALDACLADDVARFETGKLGAPDLG